MHFQKLRNRNALTIITPTRREQTDLLLMPCALVCVDSSVPFLSHQYLHQLFCHYSFFVNPVQAVWAKNLLQQEMRISELVNTHRAKLLTPSMPPAKKKEFLAGGQITHLYLFIVCVRTSPFLYQRSLYHFSQTDTLDGLCC